MPIERITYAKGHQKSNSADSAVKDHGQTLERRGASQAYIRGTWHANERDSKEHLMVDFQGEDGKHVTTHHVYRPKGSGDKMTINMGLRADTWTSILSRDSSVLH